MSELHSAVMVHLGQGVQQSAFDARKASIVIEERTPRIRRGLLEGANWRFAIARANLVEATEEGEPVPPAFGYGHQFLAPEGLLRPIGPYDPCDPVNNMTTSAAAWAWEGDRILADSPEFQLYFVRDVPNTAEWTNLFFEVVAMKLAQVCAYSITGRTDIVNALAPLIRDAENRAKFTNQIAGTPETVMAEGYLNAQAGGYYGGGGW